MTAFIPILLSFSISGLIGCASAPRKSILEERAGYGVNVPPLGQIGPSGGVRYVPTRVPEKVVVAWLHAHELSSHDYFWGSWLSIVVAPEGWEMKKEDVPKADNLKVKQTPDRPNVKPMKRPKASPQPAA